MFALLSVSRSKGLNLSDPDVAAEVTKVGGGHPGNDCIRLWRNTFEADPEWYPGTVRADAKPPGRPKVATVRDALVMLIALRTGLLVASVAMFPVTTCARHAFRASFLRTLCDSNEHSGYHAEPTERVG